MLNNNALVDFIGHDRVASLNAALKDAKGLPGYVYHDPAIWELERRSIFRKGWFAAAYASEVPEKGDALPITVAGWDLLFVNGGDGVIRCFHNVCRHRGTKLILEKTKTAILRCGWHCWSYNLQGQLVATPMIGGPGVNRTEGLEHETLGLVPVRVEQWMDALFVNIDGNAPPLAEHLQPLSDHVAPFGVEGVQLGAASKDEIIMEANWKVFLEGGLEGYHLPWVHPGLEQPPQYKITIAEDCFIDTSGTQTCYKRVGTMDGSVPRFSFLPKAAEAEKAGEVLPYSIAFTVPTAIVAVWPEYMMITLVRPVSVDRTAIRRRFYFLGEAATDPALAPVRDGLLAFHEQVAREDFGFSKEVQRLGAQRDDIGLDTRFVPYWEGAVRAFQQYVVRNTVA